MARGSSHTSCVPPRGAQVLEAHLDEGTYVLVPITGGVRPYPPDLDDPTAERAPYRPVAPQLLSTAVVGALQQLVFLYDTDMDNRLGRADLMQVWILTTSPAFHDLP